jgi:hypothetical protein
MYGRADGADDVRTRLCPARGAEQSGEWDGPRHSQALTNLIVNAGEHAPPGTSVAVGLADEGDDVTLTIHNMGEPPDHTASEEWLRARPNVITLPEPGSWEGVPRVPGRGRLGRHPDR